MESTNHYPMNNNLMAIVNQLANDDDADDSLSPLATTNNNHCNMLQQQTTPLPFSMNVITLLSFIVIKILRLFCYKTLPAVQSGIFS